MSLSSKKSISPCYVNSVYRALLNHAFPSKSPRVITLFRLSLKEFMESPNPSQSPHPYVVFTHSSSVISTTRVTPANRALGGMKNV